MKHVQRLTLSLWVLGLTACGGSPPAEQSTSTPEQQKTVFDPLVGTIDRAKAVQQTVDEQAAEQRRKIEQAER